MLCFFTCHCLTSKEVFADVGVVASPDNVINKVMVDVDKDDEKENIERGAKYRSVIRQERGEEFVVGEHIKRCGDKGEKQESKDIGACKEVQKSRVGAPCSCF